MLELKHPKSQRIGLCKVALEAAVLERHIRRSKISVRESSLRSSCEALPRNQRLLSTARAGETHPGGNISNQSTHTHTHTPGIPLDSLMIHRPDAEIPNEHRVAAQIRRGRGIVVAMRRRRAANDRRTRRLR